MVSGTGLDGGLAGDGAHLPPQRHAHAGEQLGHAERLHHVVVSAELEQVNLLSFVRAHRENDDRDARPRTNALDDVGTIHIRQPEVDDHQIDRPQCRRADRFGACAGFVHDETIELESGAQKPADLNLVIYDEHDWRWLTHRCRFQVVERRLVSRAVQSPLSYRGLGPR